MSLGWVLVAAGLELASCLSFVVLFRMLFEIDDARDARELAWTSLGAGALLPAGGIGGLAIGAWALSLTGAATAWVVRRSTALFLLTSAVNVVTVVPAALLWSAQRDGRADAVLPLIGACGLLALGRGGGPARRARAARRRRPSGVARAHQRRRARRVADPARAALAAGRRARLPVVRHRGAVGRLRGDRPRAAARRARARLPHRPARQRAAGAGRDRGARRRPGRSARAATAPTRPRRSPPCSSTTRSSAGSPASAGCWRSRACAGGCASATSHQRDDGGMPGQSTSWILADGQLASRAGVRAASSGRICVFVDMSSPR